jgi:type I restriction enzyme S subunit
VAKIEELFTRLDAGVEALKKIKAELKRYRQSVLKAAFEGKLTAEWREKNKDKLEPAIKLLERIAKELEKNAKGKIKKLPPLDTSNLPELPEGWAWAEFANISTKITDGEHIRPKTINSGVRFLSAKDVRENGVVFDDALYVSAEDAKKYRKRCDPESGDILIVSRGATVGRSCVVNTTEKFCLLGSVILIKLSSLLNNKCVSYTIKSSDIHRKLFLISGSTAQQAIYLRDIKRVTIPFCSLPEQNKIVAEIERHCSITDEVEQTIEKCLKECDQLRQSILKRAFEGKLVTQDPADEPAEKLLERIRAEKITKQRESKPIRSKGVKK